MFCCLPRSSKLLLRALVAAVTAAVKADCAFYTDSLCKAAGLALHPLGKPVR